MSKIITIKSEDLRPYLKKIILEIFDEILIRTSENGADILLDIDEGDDKNEQ